jgi:predicted amidohydrolase
MENEIRPEVSRREFLKTSTLAGATAALATNSLLESRDPVQAEEYVYRSKPGLLPDMIATVRDGKLYDPLQKDNRYPFRRFILKGGHVVDPKNNIDEVRDVLVEGKFIKAVEPDIKPEKGDRVKDVSGLYVFPGFIDLHNHMHDLFEITTRSVFEAAANGITVNLSPGVANTFMACAFLGAEVDRGVPTNVTVYIGNPCLASARASVDEKIAYFNGTLPDDVALQKITRNPISNATAKLAIGVKDHMGHCIQSDEDIDAAYEITSKTGLLFASHTQDPIHAERVFNLSKGRPLHLGHCTASGAGTHMDPVESITMIGEIIAKNNHVTGEYVTSMLRHYRGGWEGLIMDAKAQKIAYDHLSKGIVKVLVADGQLDATMKGFGDTRDTVPCVFELVEAGVLTLPQAVACVTINPALLMQQKTKQDWWTRELGHLGPGARANITVADKRNKMARLVIVNGVIAGFEGRAVRSANGAGGWVTRFGILDRTGVGDLVMWNYIA